MGMVLDKINLDLICTLKKSNLKIPSTCLYNWEKRTKIKG